MGKAIYTKKYSCLFYSEGGKDKNFLYALSELDKFKKYYAANWQISFGHASGSSPRTILEQCVRESKGISYDLIVCFIDLDKLKDDCKKKDWHKEKEKLEIEFNHFSIIWQEDNLEDEFKRVLGDDYEHYGKHKLNQTAKTMTDKFINSKYWNKIKGNIVNRERELEEQNGEGSV